MHDEIQSDWRCRSAVFCAGGACNGPAHQLKPSPPGNPHSKYCDYIAWSKWRQRGAWDSSLDNACYFNPAFIPGECSFNQQGQVLFGAHP
jgi:hypothetical protein